MLSRKLEEAKDITEQNNLLNKKSQIENRK
jgi:hypothetical protein